MKSVNFDKIKSPGDKTVSDKEDFNCREELDSSQLPENSVLNSVKLQKKIENKKQFEELQKEVQELRRLVMTLSAKNTIEDPGLTSIDRISDEAKED